MSYTTRTEEELWFLVSRPLSECVKRWPNLTYNTLKGKRAYWRNKLNINLENGKAKSMENLRTPPPEDKEPEIDRNTELAIEFLSQTPAELHDLLEIYSEDKDKPHEIEITLDKPSVKVLYLNELLLGHKDADVRFFTRVIDMMPDDVDAVVVSGILQGDFKLLQKARRKSLRTGMDSMDTQFRYANQMLQTLADTGKPVIYNLSNDDRRVAEEYTIEQFRIMLDLANAADKVNYYQIDKMKTHPKWQEHLAFQTSYVFPYCLRSGRRLRTAEEIKALSQDEMDVSEYLMLFDTFKRLEKGEDPNPDYLPYIEVENLGDTTFKITDDVNMKFTTKGAEKSDWVRHNLGFSNEPMYQSFMNVPYEIIGQLASHNKQTPSMLVLQHNLEEVGVMKDGTWIVSCGGFIKADSYINSKGSKTDIAGDQTKRVNTTRRRIPSPSASAHERFDDGRHIVTIYNEALLAKAGSCERTTITAPSDFQIASLTARPDLLVKYLDYVQSGSEPLLMAFNGDFIQGRNYPSFPNENQQLGLIALENQMEFTANLLGQVLTDKMYKAIVQPGNHEWNSDKMAAGAVYIRYLRDVLDKKGIPVHIGSALQTDRGELFKTWSTVEYVGDYGVYVSHQPLKKGAKGGGGLPIYQAQAHTAGLGNAKKAVDFELYGHWHHPQYALFGDKVAVISGSIAGLSGYEWDRGYRPVISATVLHVGGNLPPQLEFLSEEFLHHHQVADGPFSDKALKQAGFEDDPDFDPRKDGIYSFGPKSALQKYILQMMKQASEGGYSQLR